MVSLQADANVARASAESEHSGDGYCWRIGAVTDRGVVRLENQDGWAMTPCRDGSYAVLLADGMGGHADGALAARVALEEAADVLAAALAPLDALADAFAAADAAVGRAGRNGSGCGTTLVIAVLEGLRCRVAHLGDSRAYRVAVGRATPLTQDHTWVGEQERAGLLTVAQAAVHPQRNLLTQAVTGEGLRPDIVDATLAPGELLLLCSDGLWSPLEAAQITTVLDTQDPVLGLGALVDAAIAAGSTDNVTGVGCRLLGSPPRQGPRESSTG